jgi:hypothetical protein
MIKSTRNGYCDHVQDIRNLSARVENSAEFGMGVWLQFGRSLGGERWDGKEEEGETEDESVGRWVHIMVFSDGINSVGDAVGDIATSLYDYHSLNPSVLSVGKIA